MLDCSAALCCSSDSLQSLLVLECPGVMGCPNRSLPDSVQMFTPALELELSGLLCEELLRLGTAAVVWTFAEAHGGTQ